MGFLKLFMITELKNKVFRKYEIINIQINIQKIRNYISAYQELLEILIIIERKNMIRKCYHWGPKNTLTAPEIVASLSKFLTFKSESTTTRK